MGMEKAIEHGKEHRKPYYGAKAIARSCRNHGSCSWCEMNRKHKYLKKMLDNEELKCYNDYSDKEKENDKC